MHGHRKRQFQIASRSPEERVLGNLNVDIQVTRGSAPRARIASSRHGNAIAVGRSWAQFQCDDFAASLHPDTLTGSARLNVQTSRPGARLTSAGKDKMSANPPARAAAGTHRTEHRRSRHAPVAAAGIAAIMARDGERYRGAENGVAKRHRRGHLQIRAARRRRCLSCGILEDIRKQLGERRGQRPFGGGRKVEARKRHGDFPLADAVATVGAAVVIAPALEVTESLERILHAPEHLFGRAVTRVDARVISPREPAIRTLDVNGRCRSRDAEKCVQVHLLLLLHHFGVDHIVGVAVAGGRASRGRFGTAPRAR